MIALCIYLYRILEKIDGEKGWKLLSYAMAEQLKIKLLNKIK